MTNEKKLQNIQEFLISVKNMLESKYILIDRRVADILRAIANTNDVYNLIAECMINFDFGYEWKKATSSEFLKLPETDAKKIAFIFCMLNNIDDKKLDITEILERYFSYDIAYSSYDQFCRYIIVEFRRLILKLLGIEIVMPVQVSAENYEFGDTQTANETDNYEKLEIVLREFIKFLGEQKKLKNCLMPRYDMIAVASTFEQVVKNRQIEYIYAFLVTLNSVAPKNKEVRLMIDDINKLCNSILSKGK